MAGKSVIAVQSGATAVTSSSSGKELPSDAGSLSNLNPNAKEFIPVAAHKLSVDAPSFYYHRDGSSSSYSPNHRRNVIEQNESKIRRTIYIPEVPEDITEWDLAMHFKLCGTIKECRICDDLRSPRRLAFLEFSNESEASAALSLSGKSMLGYSKEVVLKILPSKTAIVPVSWRFLPKSNHEMERAYRTVYCTNIDMKVSETELVDFFEQCCGKVTEYKILYDPKHFTYTAFVELAQSEAATSALCYSGTIMGDLPIRISPSKTPVKPVPRRRW